MRVGTNILGLQIGNRLQNLNKILASNLARLSSGSRISEPKDDIAGLSVSIGLTSQIRGFAQVLRNINNAVAALNVADSGIQSQADIVLKMRELAQRASNGTLTSSERAALNTEFASLLADYERIADNTNFNGQSLLNGTQDRMRVQVGTNAGETIDLSFASTKADQIFTQLAGTGNFNTASTFATTGTAHFIRVADVDNDGVNDLVHANGVDFSVKLGSGGGLLSSPILFDTTSTGRAFDLGDLDGDGNIDLVHGSGGAGYSLTVAFGDGHGNFTIGQTVAAGTPTSVLRDMDIKDIDADGDLDIVQTSFNYAAVAIYLNNGNGTFQTGVTYATGGTSSLTSDVEDINNDGLLDIVTANLGSDSLSVFLGTGSGQFAAATTLAAENQVFDPHLVDINEDGVNDIVVGAEGTNITIYLGNGDGTFQTRTTIASSTFDQYIVVEDFNSDGHLDIANKDGTNIAIRLGNGDGTFAATKTYSSGLASPYGFGIGDLNDDGVIDLIIGDAAANQVSILSAHSLTASAVQLLTLETQENAENALAILDTALDNLLSARSGLSAEKSRLEFAAAHSLKMGENLSAARSTIIDVDIALETAELVKNQILQDINTSILAQANLNRKLVLELLKSS